MLSLYYLCCIVEQQAEPSDLQQSPQAKTVYKKVPFSIEMIQAFVQDTKRNNSLANIRLATVCLLGCAGFLRYDELGNIISCDLQLRPSCVTIKVPKSKNDRMR